MVVMAEEQDLVISPQRWGFPSTLQNTALTGVTAIRDQDRAGQVQGCSVG